jgi:hypothetical protein
MFGNEHSLPMFKDLFKLDCYTNYLSVKFNLDVIQQHKKYFADINAYADSSFVYKQYYYEMLGAKLMSPLYKATGFETLKNMFAQETGIYNQFDKLYRYPLQSRIMSEPWAANMLTKTGADRQVGNLNEIFDQAKEIIINENCSPCNVYRFDF